MRITLIGAVAAALLASGLGAVSAADDTVVIGAAVAHSGWMAAYDEGPLAAAQMAVDEINKTGGLLGKKLVIKDADTKTEVAGAAQAGAELIDAGAKMLIISCDFDMGGPSALVANQKQVLSFSTCGADAKLGNGAIGRYVFSLASEAESIGATMGDWSARKQGWKSVYFLADPGLEFNKSLCRGFEAAWTKAAGPDSIVGRDSYRNDDASVSAQITRFKSLPKKPDVIAICGVTPGFPTVLRQFRAAGIDTPFVTGENADGDGWRDSVPKEELSKFYYASYSSARGDDPRPEIKAFNETFVARTGKQPSTGQAVTGHSVVTAWARAVERAKSFDSDAVLAELEKMKDEPLLAGLSTFTPEMHITVGRPLLVFEYEHGEPHATAYYSPATHGDVAWWK